MDLNNRLVLNSDYDQSVCHSESLIWTLPVDVSRVVRYTVVRFKLCFIHVICHNRLYRNTKFKMQLFTPWGTKAKLPKDYPTVQWNLEYQILMGISNPD